MNCFDCKTLLTIRLLVPISIINKISMINENNILLMCSVCKYPYVMGFYKQKYKLIYKMDYIFNINNFNKILFYKNKFEPWETPDETDLKNFDKYCEKTNKLKALW